MGKKRGGKKEEKAYYCFPDTWVGFHGPGKYQEDNSFFFFPIKRKSPLENLENVVSPKDAIHRRVDISIPCWCLETFGHGCFQARRDVPLFVSTFLRQLKGSYFEVKHAMVDCYYRIDQQCSFPAPRLLEMMPRMWQRSGKKHSPAWVLCRGQIQAPP